MSYSHAERLTALDSMFLDIEEPNVPMHVGSVGIYERGPLCTPEGTFDLARFEANAYAALERMPRFRQKLAWTPVLGRPVWVDDPHFNLKYHVRHTSLPRPGDERQLKRLAGRIFSQQLDRGKPLWEMWVVEGLEEDRFAIVSKIHHAMMDGVASVDLITALLRTDPDPTVEPTKPWIPRPLPGGLSLLAGEVAHRVTLPLQVLGRLASGREGIREVAEAAQDAASALGESIRASLWSASATPLNPTIGPHRRFDWTRFEFDALREVGKALGGTVNDLVLTTVAGALGRFLTRRGLRPAELDIRAMVPVNIRPPEKRGTLGNRVSFLLAELPIDEPDPRKRLGRVIETTRRVKGSRMTHGAEVIEQLADITMTSLFVEFARIAATSRAYNLVVTNVPGPQFPAYLLGAKLLDVYPLVPLYQDQALGIALFSYDGGLFWGFNSDWDAMPDLHELVEAVEVEFELLRKAAVPPAAGGKPGS